ncbi:hypothetical protein RJ640_004709 [Escallonia rubra]|uniref:GDSL esterase/lipase n=1 Tax=Escallonia rubra TaxID=112253 RepID=A0AA88UPX8_9ASTE|nr:hypothetical protein RJ640_004709 [Escallonia rubra]
MASSVAPAVTFFFFFFSLALCLGFSAAQQVPAMYVFGDSLVDVGNNNHLKVSFAKADFPHNGVDYPGGKPTGRFSNGKNAADFLGIFIKLDTNSLVIHKPCSYFLLIFLLAILPFISRPKISVATEKVGIPTSPPYLSMVSKAKSNKSTSSFVAGVSFASGGAGIFNGTDERYRQSLTLTQQVGYYSTVYESLVQQLGTGAAHDHLAKSLFAVVIGSNDILGYFKAGSKSKLPKEGTPQEFRLHGLGARKYVITGIVAVGCCPSQRKQNKTGACNEEANFWATKYNDGLKSMLQGLKSELKDINYSYLDIYSIFHDFIQNPATYGFTELKAACCGLGNLNADVPCIPISNFCSNRNDHLFWDLYHPTEKAAGIMVDTVYNGSNVKELIAA